MQPPNAMGCFPFANFHFQMGVTVMGFGEPFWALTNTKLVRGSVIQATEMMVCEDGSRIGNKSETCNNYLRIWSIHEIYHCTVVAEHRRPQQFN